MVEVLGSPDLGALRLAGVPSAATMQLGWSGQGGAGGLPPASRGRCAG